MAKSIKKFLKSFTLIELIIVIAIIAVLGASAFLVLSQWMSKSRDSRKIADLGTIDTAINVSFTSKDKLPKPDNMTNITFGGVKVWELGYFGDEAVNQIGGALTKTPSDPTTKVWYRYAVWNNKYQLGTIIENENFSKYTNRVYAQSYFTKIQGNYNQSIIVTKIGTDDVIIPAPSLIVDEFTGTSYTLVNEYFWSEKNSYELGKVQKNKLQVQKLFSGDISELTQPTKYEEFKTKFADIYSGTVYLKELTPDLEPEKIDEIVSAELKKVSTQNVTVQYLSCTSTINSQSSITSIDIDFSIPTTEHGGTFSVNKTVNENNGTFKYTLQGKCNNGIFENITLGTPVVQSCDTDFANLDGQCLETHWTGDETSGYSFVNYGQQVYPKSCKEIVDSSVINYKIGETQPYNGINFEDGVYFIKPDSNPAFKVYCDMTTDGGGWTLITNLVDINGRSFSPTISDTGIPGLTSNYSISWEKLFNVNDDNSKFLVRYGSSLISSTVFNYTNANLNTGSVISFGWDGTHKLEWNNTGNASGCRHYFISKNSCSQGGTRSCSNTGLGGIGRNSTTARCYSKFHGQLAVFYKN
ncbi:MAG: fibrinogen-like YCDxxxxGGGW domain-containing protein [Candidatus Absconditabacteria bacterium]